MKRKSIVEQLNAAFEGSGLSVQKLLDESELEIDRSSLARKLSGDLPMKTDEAEILARVLKVNLEYATARAS